MNTKNLFLLSLSFKLSIIAGIVFVHYLCSQVQVWFKELETPDSITEELSDKDVLEHVDDYNKEGLTGVMFAARLSDFPRVKLLVEHGADVNLVSKTAEKTTALQLACSVYTHDRQKIVALLLENGANPNARDANGNTAAHKVLKALIDPSVTNFRPAKKILGVLVDYGMLINAQNNDGNTILHISAKFPNIGWSRMLRKYYGAMLDYEVKNNSRRTPHAAALNFRNDDLAKELVQLTPEEKTKFIGYVDVGERDDNGRTGLMLALSRGDLVVAKEQLGKGADIYTQDKWGNGPLVYACLNTGKPIDLLDILFAQEEKIKDRLKKKQQPMVARENKKGKTALHLISAVGGLMAKEVASSLLAHGASMYAKDKEGNTAVHNAVLHGNKELLFLFADKTITKIIPALKNKYGLTPQDMAKKMRNKGLFEPLGIKEIVKSPGTPSY